MRPLLFGILLVVPIAGCSSSGGWFTNQREQVLEAYKKYYEARIAEDWETLDKSLAKEFVYHMPTGVIATKKTYLEAQQAEDAVKIVSNVSQESFVRVYEGTAINRGLSLVEIEVDGEKQTAPLRYLNVWIWRDGRWQLTARQSRIEKPPSAPAD